RLRHTTQTAQERSRNIGRRPQVRDPTPARRVFHRDQEIQSLPKERCFLSETAGTPPTERSPWPEPGGAPPPDMEGAPRFWYDVRDTVGARGTMALATGWRRIGFSARRAARAGCASQEVPMSPIVLGFALLALVLLVSALLS